jgi:hypothetical protein
VKSSDFPPPVSKTTTSTVSPSSIIRFSTISYSTDRYVMTVFFGLPNAFLTARDLSSSLGRTNLAGTTNGVVGKRGDERPLVRSRKSGGNSQKLSLP